MTNNNLRATINGTHILHEGALIKDFRGEVHTFIRATRAPQPGKSGKVLTNQGEYYHTVFPGVEVEEVKD